jgi:hypothetical protein
VCIRDDQGRFILAKTEWYSPVIDVGIDEALGLMSTLQWVRVLQLTNIDFELDAKVVVDKFHSSKIDLSELGDILKECRNIFVSNFTNSHRIYSETR